MAIICYLYSLVLLTFGSQAFHGTSQKYAQLSMFERHQQWMSHYGRVYKDQTEEEQRFNVFKNNVEFIDTFNDIKGRSYQLSVNEFTDLTNEEFARYRNGFRSTKTAAVTSRSFMYENVTNLPTSVDWREKGAMTPVKDQGQCGCCWAFSAVAAVEGINQIKTGKLVGLSEQEIVDCDKTSVDQGCDGGLMNKAFEFIQHNRGLATQTNYPYQGADGSCNDTQANIRVAQIKGFEDVPPDEDELLKAVANQPVSAAIDGSGSAFQFYSSGILDGECGTDLSHGVTIVGYGTSDDGTKYWLIKNSWGSGWGEEGYLRIRRGVNPKKGLCGIAKGASYPLA